MEKAKTRNEISQNLRERRAELGLVRVEVWVHKEDRDELLAYAKKLRGGTGGV